MSKAAVIGIRGETGAVRAQISPNTKISTLRGFVVDNAPADAVVVTNQHAGYVGLVAKAFTHISFNHSVGEYVREMARINRMESFWALLKRGRCNIFHYMSAKHLHRYVNEFASRHMIFQIGTTGFIDRTVTRMVGKHFTYEGLTNA